MFSIVHYPGLKKAEYRVAKVSKVMLDQRGSVRYKHKDLGPMTLPVQRTALLMPSAEVSANTPDHTTAFASISLSSGFAIPTSVMAYAPAMQLKEYKQYKNYRKVEGDMRCEPSVMEVNVWKLD